MTESVSWSDGWRDPTHGRVDRDIQEYVHAMKGTSLGQIVAIENTLQDRRNKGTRLSMKPYPIHLARDGAPACGNEGVAATHPDSRRTTCTRCLSDLETQAIESIVSAFHESERSLGC